MNDERSLDSYFIDWEAEVFGFGYGSGEPHTVPALHTFFTLCPPNDADCRSYDYRVLEDALTPAVAWLLINALGKADVIEYGTSPRAAWLRPNGYRLRDFVLSKTPDELVTLATTFDEHQPHCGPQSCNCGPNGYDAARKCPNPFWREEMPQPILARTAMKAGGRRGREPARRPRSTPKSKPQETP